MSKVNPLLANPNLRHAIFTKWGTWLTPIGRLSYPTLFKARAMPGADPSTAKFSTSLIMPASVDLRPLAKAIEQIATDKWNANVLKTLKHPILEHAEKTADSDLAEEFPYLIRCSSNQQPGCVYATTGEDCKVPAEVYGGRWARVSVKLFTWEHPASGKGVSFGLQNVQLWDNDDPFSGVRVSPQNDFDGYFVSDLEKGTGNAGAADFPF